MTHKEEKRAARKAAAVLRLDWAELERRISFFEERRKLVPRNVKKLEAYRAAKALKRLAMV